jgi:hypothetical protein
MEVFMRKWFSLLILAALLFLPVGAKAQGPVDFATLDVSIWPEYDTPTVLVIYRISLGPQVTLPVDVTVKMPPTVGKLAAVAVGNTADTVSDTGVDYKFTPGNDFATVTVKATGRFLHIEYYDPALIINGSQHSYRYSWNGDNAVERFGFDLRQPLQSSNLSTEPALSAPVKDTEGFETSTYSKTNLKAGDTLSFAIQYQRDTDAPSTSFMKIESTTPLDQTVTGQSNWTTYLPWLLGALGFALLFVAGWIYWSSGRNTRAAATTRRRHMNRTASEPAASGGQVHCSQCGKRAEPADRFCRACGTRLRRRED